MKAIGFATALASLFVAVPALAGQEPAPKQEKPKVEQAQKKGEQADKKGEQAEKKGEQAEKKLEQADKQMEKGAVVGKPAPDFSLKDLDGKPVKLSDYKDKVVVLEWFNPNCPFVAAAHGKDGALRDLPSKAAADGVVWLTINSSAAGQEGAGVEANKKMRDEWKISNPVLLDESGTVGRAYGAKSTPHMFVIDAKGVLAYSGALDNAPQGKVEGDKKVNHVEAAIAELKAGKPVTNKETKPYGCPVKYAAKPGS